MKKVTRTQASNSKNELPTYIKVTLKLKTPYHFLSDTGLFFGLGQPITLFVPSSFLSFGLLFLLISSVHNSDEAHQYGIQNKHQNGKNVAFKKEIIHEK